MAEVGTTLSVLCRFVSNLRNAKKEWDVAEELSKSRESEFEDDIELSNRFLRDLITITASHISGNTDTVYNLSEFLRILWETWNPYDKELDFVYSQSMRNYRRQVRHDAVQGVPEDKQTEYQSHLSRLHKILVILLSQELKDEGSENIYRCFSKGFTTLGSFLEPLGQLSSTQLYTVLTDVFSEWANGMNAERAQSFLEFCLISHLLFDGSFPATYEGNAFLQIGPKKLSIAMIVDGGYTGVPVDSHVEKFFSIFAKSQAIKDLKRCYEVFRLRTDPKVGRYANDFIAEIGQILGRGTESSIKFAIAVLKELGSISQEYKSIIAKWLGCYKNHTNYEKILDGCGIE